MKETTKAINGTYRLSILDYGVGPVTESDIQNALLTGAVIFGFDVDCKLPVEKGDGCCIKLHKLVHRFVEDISKFVHDAKL